MPTSQASVPARSAQPTVLSAVRKSGKAIMRRKVSAFPNQVTSIRRAPSIASARVAPATSTSRTSTATANHDGHGSVDEDPADPDEEQEPVGHWIEDLADVGHLVEAASDVAVEEVGDPEHGEETGGLGPVLLGEQQPEEHRQHRQPHDGDDVRDREDPVGPHLAGGVRHGFTLRCALDADALHQDHRRRHPRPLRVARGRRRRLPHHQPDPARVTPSWCPSPRSTTGSTSIRRWPRAASRSRRSSARPR